MTTIISAGGIIEVHLMMEDAGIGMDVGGAGAKVEADLGAALLAGLAMIHHAMRSSRLDLVCRERRGQLTVEAEVLVPMLPYLPRRERKKRQSRDAIRAEGIDRDDSFRHKRGRKLYGLCKRQLQR